MKNRITVHFPKIGLFLVQSPFRQECPISKQSGVCTYGCAKLYHRQLMMALNFDIKPHRLGDQKEAKGSPVPEKRYILWRNFSLSSSFAVANRTVVLTTFSSRSPFNYVRLLLLFERGPSKDYRRHQILYHSPNSDSPRRCGSKESKPTFPSSLGGCKYR